MLVIGDDETMMMLSQSFGKKTRPVKFECLSLGETAENMKTHSFTCGNTDNLELNFVFKYIILCLSILLTHILYVLALNHNAWKRSENIWGQCSKQHRLQTKDQHFSE